MSEVTTTTKQDRTGRKGRANKLLHLNSSPKKRRKYYAAVKLLEDTLKDERIKHSVRFQAANRLIDLYTMFEQIDQKREDRAWRLQQRELGMAAEAEQGRPAVDEPGDEETSQVGETQGTTINEVNAFLEEMRTKYGNTATATPEGGDSNGE